MWKSGQIESGLRENTYRLTDRIPPSFLGPSTGRSRFRVEVKAEAEREEGPSEVEGERSETTSFGE